MLSADQENDADVLGVVAASAALSVSKVPCNGPLAGGARGPGRRASGSSTRRSSSSSSPASTWSSSGSADSIVMVEGGALEVTEAEMLEALKVAQKGIRELIGLQKS